ncbi:MAG TPA: lysophospholipid acyltransferase family protein [Candidatus Paceibacterota bacterium]|nr:lysophospholipid acyltransferase family protein [Candidatus Paceibacterota bacterium]
MNNYSHPWYVAYTYPVLHFIFKIIIKPVWIKEVTGMERIPVEGPVIIAFNHQSYFDFLSFMVVCPRPIHFLAAEKFFSHVLWAPLMKLSGQIHVDRRNHEKNALHDIVDWHLGTGKAIGIFPEGTRAFSDTDMAHAFTGVAKYAVKAKVPVIPVGIKGAFEVMSRHDKVPKLKKVISIHVGHPIHFTEHHGKEVDEITYRQLTDKVMIELSHLSGKTYNHVGKMERDLNALRHIPK